MEVCNPAETSLTQNLNEPSTKRRLSRCSSLESFPVDDESNEVEYNRMLQDRLMTLRATMYDLKSQLKNERDSWQKEVESMKMCTTSYDFDRFSGRELGVSCSLPGCNQTHQTYEEAINHAHTGTRVNLQRQIAISNYRRRLMEVENMCNMELLRVKQSVQFLQPLQMIASEWNCNKDLNDCGEGTFQKVTDASSETDTEDSKQKEVTMPLELAGNKLYNEMNDMFSKLSAQCNESVPQLSTELWQSDDKLKSFSSVWYNECVPTKQN